MESANHLFVTSEVAVQVWARIYKLMNQHSLGYIVAQVLFGWWKQEGISNWHQWLCKVLPGATIWMIWKSRNEEKYNGHPMQWEFI